jgi:hypothetical protein
MIWEQVDWSNTSTQIKLVWWASLNRDLTAKVWLERRRVEQVSQKQQRSGNSFARFWLPIKQRKLNLSLQFLLQVLGVLQRKKLDSWALNLNHGKLWAYLLTQVTSWLVNDKYRSFSVVYSNRIWHQFTLLRLHSNCKKIGSLNWP